MTYRLEIMAAVALECGMPARKLKSDTQDATGSTGSVPSKVVEAEFAAANFKDRRLTRRLRELASTLSDRPSASFPEAMGSDAALEATYRFLSNERVTPTAILAPHLANTAARVRAADGQVVVAHDTTEFNYGRFEREGLGRVGRGKAFGVYAHIALAVSRDDRAPLGVLGLRTHTRDGEPKPHLKHGANQFNPDNEARRWPELVSAVCRELDQPGLVIHVMDREADDYALFAHMMQEPQERFVVRQYRARRLSHHGQRCDVRSVLDDVPFVIDRIAEVSARRPSDMPAYRERHPAREVRTAVLSFRAMQITLPRPETASERPEASLTLNLVHVFERQPPAGCEPIEWWLWTNEPIDTPEQIIAIADAYRARWVIEEFNKALKSGCAIEKRQLETKDALLNALAVVIPIAWQLLALRTIAREDPSQPASAVLTPLQLACLIAAYLKLTQRRLADDLSAQDALSAIAKLGGHLRHNGPPGWIVLHRGFRKLLDMVEGYQLGLADGDVMNR